jgi:hypothetical protein
MGQEMSDSEQSHRPATEANPGSDAAKNRSKRGSGKRGGRPPAEQAELQRGQRSRPDRNMIGFGDGIERAICQAVISRPPLASPVQHRTGVATSRFVEIARTDTAWLYCNGEHFGPCVWPNGDVVGAPPRVPPDPEDQAVVADA